VGCRLGLFGIYTVNIKPFNAKLNPICHLPSLLEARHILHVRRIKVKNPLSSGKQLKFKTQQYLEFKDLEHGIITTVFG